MKGKKYYRFIAAALLSLQILMINSESAFAKPRKFRVIRDLEYQSPETFGYLIYEIKGRKKDPKTGMLKDNASFFTLFRTSESESHEKDFDKLITKNWKIMYMEDVEEKIEMKGYSEVVIEDRDLPSIYRTEYFEESCKVRELEATDGGVKKRVFARLHAYPCLKGGGTSCISSIDGKEPFITMFYDNGTDSSKAITEPDLLTQAILKNVLDPYWRLHPGAVRTSGSGPLHLAVVNEKILPKSYQSFEYQDEVAREEEIQELRRKELEEKLAKFTVEVNEKTTADNDKEEAQVNQRIQKLAETHQQEIEARDRIIRELCTQLGVEVPSEFKDSDSTETKDNQI